jgi:hypothetical protein
MKYISLQASDVHNNPLKQLRVASFRPEFIKAVLEHPTWKNKYRTFTVHCRMCKKSIVRHRAEAASKISGLCLSCSNTINKKDVPIKPKIVEIEKELPRVIKRITLRERNDNRHILEVETTDPNIKVYRVFTNDKVDITDPPDPTHIKPVK